MSAREELHRLVDALPEGELAAATRCLELLQSGGDPLLGALREAPEEDEPISPEEDAAVKEALREAERGEVIRDEELWRRLGHEPRT